MAEEEEACRPPFMVLSDYVRDYSFMDQQHGGEPYRMVECRSKAAYGCGPNGDAIVRGLELLVRLGGGDADDPYSRPDLCVRASDEVFLRVGTELDVDKVKLYGSGTRLSGRIYTLDGDVMVLCIYFIPSFFLGGEVSYYLVYDSAAASLSLLPGLLPPCCRPACTEFPLMVKVGGEEEDTCRYSLALMADRSTSSASAKYTDPVLCLWSSSPHHDNNNNNRRGAWDLKARVRVNAAMADPPFEAHVVFSCKGHAVWGDLAQGILYCDCDDLVDDGREPAVFKHVALPEECRNRRMPEFRTMGCGVGDSTVWFVAIEPAFDCPGDTKVKVWTLDLLPAAAAAEEWSLYRELRMQSLWELFGEEQGWPETVPDYPILRRQQQQRDDGVGVATVLYMFLSEPYAGGVPYAHQVCIELSCEAAVRLVSSRRVEFTVMQRPVVLDPDFFGPRQHMAVF